jgi:hypothetical protein
MRNILTGLFFFFGIAAATPAMACDSCATIIATGEQIVTAIGTGSALIEQGIVQAIGTLQQSNSASTIGAQNAAATQAQWTAAEFKKNDMNMYYEVAPTACTNAAMTQGVSESMRRMTARASAGGGGAVPIAAATQPDANLNTLIQIDKGLVARPSPEVEAREQAKGGCQSYSTANDIRGQSCKMAGFSNGVSAYPNADVVADTLIDGPQNPTNPMVQLTIKGGNTPQYAAIEAYLHNLNEPIEVRDLTKTELATNDGVRYMALHDIYNARMSLAGKPARDWVANMTADPNLINVVNQMTSNDPSNSTATFVNNYLQQHYPTWSSDGISMSELENIEVERRFLNGQWYNAIAQASPDAVAREQVMISAATNYLLYQLLRETEEANLMLGEIYGSNVRQEYQPQLAAAYRAAAAR